MWFVLKKPTCWVTFSGKTTVLVQSGNYCYDENGSRVQAKPWRAEGAQATRTQKGGTSGGAMVYTKPHFDVATRVVGGRSDKCTCNLYARSCIYVLALACGCPRVSTECVTIFR